jgi:hypothetical protein
MSMGMRSMAAAVVLCGSVIGCGEPQCPSGYEKKGTTCYRRPKDAGAPGASIDLRDASSSDTERAGDELEPDTETDTDTASAGGANRAEGGSERDVSPDAGPQMADAGDQRPDAGPPGTDAGDQRTDAGQQGQDAGAPVSGDAASSCTPSAEVCDGRDNDCDGHIDEDMPTWYCDDDGDGFAPSVTGKMDSCNKPPANAACRDWTTTAPSGANAQDCDDKTALRFPGAGFGLASGSNGDLNCDGQTEGRLEFVGEAGPIDFYSGATRFNICGRPEEGVLGSSDSSRCDCWLPYALVKDFVRFDTDGFGVIFSRSGDCCAVVPYYMQTFPCSEHMGDVILLRHALMFNGQCTAKQDGVAVRQLCR